MDISKYEPIYRESKALVVGINKYINSSLSPLDHAENDALAIADLLKSPEFGFKVKLLIGHRATKKSVLNALYEMRSSGPDDRLIFYFAGHGYTRIDNFGSERGYIAVSDTNPDKEFSALSLADEIISIRLYTPAKHIGFILDTCFSGQVLGLTRASRVDVRKYLIRRAYQVITAGAGDQAVADFHSMTQLMVEAIKNNLATEDGLTTFDSLGNYLRKVIAADTGKTQIPQIGQLQGSQGGEIILSIQDNQEILPVEKTKKPQTISLQSYAKSKFSPQGIEADIDLSGRIEDTNSPTVLTLSAGLSISVLISGSEKYMVIQSLKAAKPFWSATRINVLLYTYLIFLLVKDYIHKLDVIKIDPEYLGYEPVIKQRLFYLLRKYQKSVSKKKIEFKRLESHSQAHRIASSVFRGNIAPDLRLSSEDILSIESL